MPKTCPACNGSGHMDYETARDIFERDRERPNTVFGCPTCDGCGEVEAED